MLPDPLLEQREHHLSLRILFQHLLVGRVQRPQGHLV
jgi:hypothetical protein